LDVGLPCKGYPYILFICLSSGFINQWA